MGDFETIGSATITPIHQISDGVLVGGVHDASGAFVDFTKHRRWSGHISHGGSGEETPAAAAKSAPDGLYGGIFFNHFGHFLTEGLGRLWAANNPAFVNLPIYVHAMWGRPDLADNESYHALALRALGIDPGRIVVVEEPIAVSRLIAPRLLFWFDSDGLLEAKFMQFLSHAGKFIDAQVGDASARGKKLYVSRAKWDPARGIVVGEPEFEAYLREQDFVVIYPETLSFREQLIRYAGSERIIFAEGSAMHACVLLPSLKATVAKINRRPGGPFLSRQKYLGFTKEIFSISEVKKHVRFGMKDWSGMSYVDYKQVSQSLLDIGFVDVPFFTWPEIKERAETVAAEKFRAAASHYPEFVAQDFVTFVARLSAP
jgi:capsular polysaccharide biosynthesis protein